MKLSDFDFHLPPERIAQKPCTPRESARLLYVGKDTPFEDRVIADLPQFLRTGDVVVVNNSKVIPARLYGMRGAMQVEILLHRRKTSTRWEAFVRPQKRLRQNDQIKIAEDFCFRVDELEEGGLTHLCFEGAEEAMMPLIEQHGLMPLPPYIKRSKHGDAADIKDYQTVYAAPAGSVAAPTAGLHFTHGLLNNIKSKGVEVAEVTLHVGAGTFQPVKTENIAEHKMHAEWAEITQETVNKILHAKAKGGRVVAIGTTAARTLESACAAGPLAAWQGETRLFITPSYTFQIVDCLFTNFHLPKSTLFMLVSAFAGVERAKAAYAHAIKKEYRFFSYGDACFFEKNEIETGHESSERL